MHGIKHIVAVPPGFKPKSAMKFYRQVMFTLRIEAQLFVRFPRLLLASLLVICLPALYASIYLASVWDPAARAGALPVGLVNLDKGVAYHAEVFNAGDQVAANLRRKQTFGFVDFADEAKARAQVRAGTLAFALIIPADFSSNAIPGHEAGGGKLVVYTSEGNNYESALIAKDFARELGHDVNETLNQRRWQLVLLKTAGSQRNVDQLRSGVEQLRHGAHELRGGVNQLAVGTQQSAGAAQRLAQGVDQVTAGMRQLGSGVRTLDAKHPRNSDLDRLRAGAEQLAAGQTELGNGLTALQNGSQQVRNGVAAFKEEAHGSLLVPSRVSDGVDTLFDGIVQLDDGLKTATDAQGKLEDGAAKLSGGVVALTTGVHAMNAGLRTMASKLPDDALLDELDNGASALANGALSLANGTGKVRTGAERLEAGLGLLASSLPVTVDGPEGSAEGLANSVKPVLEVDARVPNSGSAFAPNVIPAALWLGAGVAAFLIHLRVLPNHAQLFFPTAQLTGKIAIPMLVVLLQAALVYLMAVHGLHIQIAEPARFALALALSSVTFLSIVFALTRTLGDAGKAIAMILLALQLSSSGGIMPVELSGDLFSKISPWLPLTWVVRAMKATMFGAYGGDWLQPMKVVALTGLLALCCACWLGRWRYLQPALVRPTVDF